jgi:dihydropteroate synthase
VICFNSLQNNPSPILMGILNITPDSFFDGGKFDNQDNVSHRINALITDNAQIIDIGAESTRPNSKKIDTDTEINRLSCLNFPLSKKNNIYFFIDTYKAKTAEFALKNGFDIVNDVTGLHLDSDMAKIVAEYQAGIIIMYNHSLSPALSSSIIDNALKSFDISLNIALKNHIPHNKICLDIGIGFGTTPYESIELIRHIPILKKLGYPILVGASRKSFIHHFLNIASPDNRLYATLATHAFAFQNGADILRIHDVKAHDDYFKMLKICQKNTANNV